MNGFLTQEYLFTIAPTVVLSLALSAVAVSYVFLLVKLGKTEKDKIFLQSKIRDQTTDILKDAHQKRLKIIQEAIEHAHSILTESQGFSRGAKDQFASDLEGIRKTQEEQIILRSEEISKLYHQFSINLQKGTEEKFNAMAKNMENKAVAEIQELRKILEDQSIFIHKQLSTRIDEEYKKAQKNIEDYKVDQMKKVDHHVFDILYALTRDVLGRSLSIHDHEDLVQKALAQMKIDMSSEI